MFSMQNTESVQSVKKLSVRLTYLNDYTMGGEHVDIVKCSVW